MYEILSVGCKLTAHKKKSHSLLDEPRTNFLYYDNGTFTYWPLRE